MIIDELVSLGGWSKEVTIRAEGDIFSWTFPDLWRLHLWIPYSIIIIITIIIIIIIIGVKKEKQQ